MDISQGTSPQVGFVGVGAMGAPMIEALCSAGWRVLATDLSQEHLLRAKGSGASTTGDRRDLASCEVVICMLPDSTAVEATVLAQDDGLLTVLQPKATVIDMGSSRPASTRMIAQRCAVRGIAFLDAPVSGGVAGARTRSLSVMVGSEESAFRRFRPLLEVFGSVIHVGDLGSGHAVKALNNLMSAAALTVTTEALAVAASYGITGEKLLEVVNHSTGRSNASETKIAQQVLSGAFDSGFRLRLMLKDLETAVEMAETASIPTPLALSCRDVWRRGARELPAAADQTEIARLPSSMRHPASPAGTSRHPRPHDRQNSPGGTDVQ